MPDNTPKIDTSKMIFVFGSNEGGIHGGGAARFAYKERGARWGLSYGLFGQSFAVPTKGVVHILEGGAFNQRYVPHVGATLSLDQIKQYVTGLRAFIQGHPELNFQITCLGCGLAGLKHADVAPVFNELRFEELPNAYFDTLWTEYLSRKAQFWGTF